MNLLLIAVLITTYLGLSLLALSQKRHWQKCAGGYMLAPSRWLRLIGLCLLLVAFCVSLVRDGPAFGSLFFILVTIVNCLAVTLSINLKSDVFYAVLKIALPRNNAAS